MIARHVSTEADPGDRGVAFGRAQAAPVGLAIETYCRLFADLWSLDRAGVAALGMRVGERLAAARPALAAELAGIAQGAGVDADLLFAINARTEILAGLARPECSVIGALPARTGAGPLLAQNWDWYPELAPARVLWTVHHDGDRWFTTLSEAGIAAKIGLNSRGLGVALNILGSSADGGVDGDPVHVLLRCVLEDCGDLASAAALLGAARASASSCITVAQASGAGRAPAMASFEISPAGAARIEPVDGVVLHTNHFLSLPPGLRDTVLPGWPDTVARLVELRAATADPTAPVDGSTVRALLRSHAAGRIAICCHDGENPRPRDRQETLVSLLMDLDARRLELAAGTPCTTAYEPVPSPGRARAALA